MFDGTEIDTRNIAVGDRGENARSRKGEISGVLTLQWSS